MEKAKIEIRKLSQLLADYEKTADETKQELSEIKATMSVNWDGRREDKPKLLYGNEKTALEMFMKIIEYYYKPKIKFICSCGRPDAIRLCEGIEYCMKCGDKLN